MLGAEYRQISMLLIVEKIDYEKLITETLRASTYFMREVKFLRCQSLELAYNLPERWVRKLHLQRVKPYVRVNNPFLISDFDLWDVELGSSGFNYPIQRTYSVGINVSF